MNSLSLDTKWKAKTKAKGLITEIVKNSIGGILPMVTMSDKDIKKETTRIAVIFLLTGLFLGSGFVLCIIDFVPMYSITIRLIGSLVIGTSILCGVVAANTLRSNVLHHWIISYYQTVEDTNKNANLKNGV